MTHGYKSFPSEVKKAMSQLVAKYNLHAVEETTSSVTFKSDKCILSVSTEYDYVEVHFRSDNADRWSFLGEFLEARYPNEEIKIEYPPDGMDRIEKIRSSLQETIRLIDKYCEPILSGECEWKRNPSNK